MSQHFSYDVLVSRFGGYLEHDKNPVLFSMSDLEKSNQFYQNVLDAKLLVKRRSSAYFDLNGIWLALNKGKDIPRNKISQSYTHIAFSI